MVSNLNPSGMAKEEIIASVLWYTRARMHSTLHYVSPMQFEQDCMDAPNLPHQGRPGPVQTVRY